MRVAIVTLTAAWPSVEDKVTVLHLEALTVQRVDYVDSVDALRTLLRAAARPTPGPFPGAHSGHS